MEHAEGTDAFILTAVSMLRFIISRWNQTSAACISAFGYSKAMVFIAPFSWWECNMANLI